MTRFVEHVVDVSHAIVVSADGLVMAANDALPSDRAEQFGAVVSGLASLAVGAAQIFRGGGVLQTVVEMEQGYLLIMAVGDGSYIAALTRDSADLGQVGYEMALLVERVGTVISAKPRTPAGY
ncbi:MAG: roadblock/LC7 domain-containing protein [Nocardioides sp.]